MYWIQWGCSIPPALLKRRCLCSLLKVSQSLPGGLQNRDILSKRSLGTTVWKYVEKHVLFEELQIVWHSIFVGWKGVMDGKKWVRDLDMESDDEKLHMRFKGLRFFFLKKGMGDQWRVKSSRPVGHLSFWNNYFGVSVADGLVESQNRYRYTIWETTEEIKAQD